MSFVPFLSSSFIYFSRLISIRSNSGALAGTSLYSFLRHPSLKSTALLVAGTSGAGLFYAGATGTKNGLEDGPWLGVGELLLSSPSGRVEAAMLTLSVPSFSQLLLLWSSLPPSPRPSRLSVLLQSSWLSVPSLPDRTTTSKLKTSRMKGEDAWRKVGKRTAMQILWCQRRMNLGLYYDRESP